MSSDLSQFDHLSFPQKLQLVEDLWDQIAQSTELIPVPDWQKEELDRRELENQEHPAMNLSWDEVKRQIRERHE